MIERLLAAGVALSVLGVGGAGHLHRGSGAPQGNVQPTLQPVTGVGVAATSSAVDDRVAVIISNATTRSARVDLVSATASRTDGGRVTHARTREAYPQVLAPGELALAAVQFRKGGVPPGASVVVKVRSRPVTDARATRVLGVSAPSLSPPGTGAVAQTLGATVSNDTPAWTAIAPQVAVMCFGEARQPTTITTKRLRVRKIAPGRQATVSVPLSTLCPTYLVAPRTT